jgi:DNA-binding PadR family transcriptional regulator
MFHPLGKDLSKLKDSEVEEELRTLTKKYYQASRLGKPELLTQLSTFITIYREEMSKRLRQNLSNGQMDKDLDQLINVD